MTSYKPDPHHGYNLAVQYFIHGQPAGNASAEQQIAAQAIVNSRTADIKRFMQVNRQFGDISGLRQQMRNYSPPGSNMDMVYLRNGSQELLKMNLTPDEEKKPPTPIPDINYDGYIGMSYMGYESGGYFAINGVKLDLGLPGDNVDVNRDGKLILIAFGPTALQCFSLHDSDNDALTGGKSLKCGPTIKQVDEHPGYEDNNAAWIIAPQDPIPKHDNAFGYWFAKYQDGYNMCNCTWATTFSGTSLGLPFWGNDPAYLFGPGSFCWNSPPIVKIYWYPNASDSPLDPTGLNRFQWGFDAKADETYSNIFDLGVAWAEFYSRAEKDQRSVSRTWTKESQQGVSYNVNDKPVVFMTNQWSSDVPGYSDLMFDLGAKAKYDDVYSSAVFGWPKTVSNYTGKFGQPNPNGTPSGSGQFQTFDSLAAFKNR
jgi:hypothetical protein